MMEFDELISNGQLTRAARLFAKEYYDSGRMGNTRRLLIERLADKCDKYDAVARQSVTSEEVAEEIERLTDVIKQTREAAKELKEQKYAVNLLPVYEKIKSLELQITALQQYQPWIPCAERMPTEDDADEDGFVLTLDADRQQADYPHSEIEVWNNRCDVKITHWRPMLPIPKGE